VTYSIDSLDYVLNKCKIRFPLAAGLNILCFLNVSALEFGTAQTPSQWRREDIFSEVKWPGSVAKHSTLPSSEIGSIWSYMSSPPYAFMECKLSTGINLPFHTSVTSCVKDGWGITYKNYDAEIFRKTPIWNTKKTTVLQHDVGSWR